MGSVAARAPLTAPLAGAAPVQTSPHESRALCQPVPLLVLQLWALQGFSALLDHWLGTARAAGTEGPPWLGLGGTRGPRQPLPGYGHLSRQQTPTQHQHLAQAPHPSRGASPCRLAPEEAVARPPLPHRPQRLLCGTRCSYRAHRAPVAPRRGSGCSGGAGASSGVGCRVWRGLERGCGAGDGGRAGVFG